MATYTPKRKTSNGTEDVTFPISAVNGLQSELDSKVEKDANGNLVIGSSKVQSNGYLIGTWLQSTANNALGSTPPRICVQDSAGWVYSRTPAQILGDIGAQPKNDNTLTTSDKTTTGAINELRAALNEKMTVPLVLGTGEREDVALLRDVINAVGTSIIDMGAFIQIPPYRRMYYVVSRGSYGSSTSYTIQALDLQTMRLASGTVSADEVSMEFSAFMNNYTVLNTTAKTIPEAINEINSKAGSGGGSASKVAITENFPSGMSYIPVLTGKSGDQSVNAHAHLYAYSGPTYSYFNVGSATVNGGLTLHNSNGKYVDINAGTPTANRTISLPDCNGTVLTTGNIGMPQIRFAGLSGYGIVHSTGESFTINGTQYVGNKLGLHFTVEIVGGGPLKVGDAIQMCSKKTYPGCKGNGYRRRQKLRRFKEYVITADDLNKRFITIHIANDEVSGARDLFHNGRADTGMFSPIYFRIRRPKGKVQNNTSGMTVDAEFSNVVTVWKSYGLRFEDDNGNTYDKFNIL